MTRTTISLESSLLKTVKRLAHNEGSTIGREISDLLAIGLHHKQQRSAAVSRSPLKLKTFTMGREKIPLEDKEGVMHLLEKGNAFHELRR